MNWQEIVQISREETPTVVRQLLDSAERQVVDDVLVASGLRDRQEPGRRGEVPVSTPIDEALKGAAEEYIRALIQSGVSERAARLLGAWIDIVIRARISQFEIERLRAELATKSRART